MCALKAHNNFYFWKFFFSRIEKVLTDFSILEKMFPKVDGLMCALRAHNNFHFWKFFFSRIEKVLTAFSILEKMFLKVDSLMCDLGHTLIGPILK